MIMSLSAGGGGGSIEADLRDMGRRGRGGYRDVGQGEEERERRPAANCQFD